MRQIKKTLEPFVVLSSREFDIFCLLAEGCSLQTIAEQLGISSKTVSNGQTQIKLKLGIDNKQQFRQVAKIHGLMSEESL
jgi:DNA-binding CsgD family transcriptional regulator